MKKILLGLFALASVSAVAAEGVNVYGRLGLDVYSRYQKIEESSVLKTKGKVAPSIAVEVTKDLGSNFEAGLGLGHVWNGKRNMTVDYEKIEAIRSIPLYVTTKYKFDAGSDVKPYVKADLGYSFNQMKKNDYDLKAKNGLYAGIGAGVEYNNVTADLSYVFTGAKYKFENGNTYKANKNAVRLTVGYKFAF